MFKSSVGVNLFKNLFSTTAKSMQYGMCTTIGQFAALPGNIHSAHALLVKEKYIIKQRSKKWERVVMLYFLHDRGCFNYFCFKALFGCEKTVCEN